MADSGSITKTFNNDIALQPNTPLARVPRLITVTWTSDASAGTVSKSLGIVEGFITRVVFVPGTSSVQPSNLYDVTILDANGVDILGGLGADRSNTASSQVTPVVDTSGIPVSVCGLLTLNVANAGNSKQGTVVLYVR